jgi:hypothetical protein
VTSSKYFPYKLTHKGTWAAPDGSSFNHIDHIGIDERFVTNTFGGRPLRGANTESDDYRVQFKYKCKINKEVNPRIRYSALDIGCVRQK